MNDDMPPCAPMPPSPLALFVIVFFALLLVAAIAFIAMLCLPFGCFIYLVFKVYEKMRAAYIAPL